MIEIRNLEIVIVSFIDGHIEISFLRIFLLYQQLDSETELFSINKLLENIFLKFVCDMDNIKEVSTDIYLDNPRKTYLYKYFDKNKFKHPLPSSL